MSVRALGYVGLGAGDVDRWADFATRVLGLEAGERDPDGTLFCRMDDRHHRIAVHPDGTDDLLYAGWEVADAAALEAVTDRLRQAGVTFAAASAAQLRERRVTGLVTCTDPNGIGAEIFWGPVVEGARPFRSPRTIEGFVTGEGGVGHIVLTVRDAAATMNFYRDVLGLRVSDFIDFERSPGVRVTMAFLHCNRRHHSVAFMQLPAPPRRLSHLMLEARALDDVGRTHTLCEAMGVPIAMSLGRHTNDDMFSFYLTSPSGFNIEYGWGGKSVDDATWKVERYDAPSVWGHRRQPIAETPPRMEPERIAR